LTVEFGCGFDEISSFGIVEAACDGAGNIANAVSEANNISKPETRACRPLRPTTRMGVYQPYPSTTPRMSHRISHAPEG